MFQPKTEAELAEILAGGDGPFVITGGGSQGLAEMGALAEATSLSMGAMRGVTLYEPGALTLVAQAGTPLAEIEAQLAAENQRLAFEPPSFAKLLGHEAGSSIGGIAAANLSGPRRINAGAARDSLIGVRFVDGSGSVISNGGRVMKNVTGIDLVKLLAGSFGTLGVLTEVSFKLLPMPETAACLILHGLSDAQAVAAMSKALGSPFEITGAAHLPQAVGAEEAQTLLRIEGAAGSVAYRAGRLADLLAEFGPVEILSDPSQIADQWQVLHDAEPFADASGPVWRASVKPSDGPQLTAALPEGLRWFYDWGGGLVWLMAQSPEAGLADDLHRAIQAACGQLGGHARLIRDYQGLSQRQSVFQPQPPILQRLAQEMRAKFDPKGILNPGLMDS